MTYETTYNLFFRLFQWYIFFGITVLFNLFDKEVCSDSITYIKA